MSVLDSRAVHMPKPTSLRIGRPVNCTAADAKNETPPLLASALHEIDMNLQKEGVPVTARAA